MEELWQLAEEESARIKASPEGWRKFHTTFFANLETGQSLEHASNYIFDPIGIILIRPLKNIEYESTPRNSLTFAETGGDGVHFGLVQMEGQILEKSPVVMTVPANYGEENLIVGGNLHEFLCLGSRMGYFLLEQLTYSDNRKQTLEDLEHPEAAAEREFQATKDILGKDHFDRDRYLLQMLRDRLSLKPWHNVAKRLKELQSFQKYLDVPSEE